MSNETKEFDNEINLETVEQFQDLAAKSKCVFPETPAEKYTSVLKSSADFINKFDRIIAIHKKTVPIEDLKVQVKVLKKRDKKTETITVPPVHWSSLKFTSKQNKKP